MRVLSERLGRLSRQQLQAALDRFELGRLLEVEPVSSGLFGQNVFLTTPSGEWVFRGAPHGPWQLAKEGLFADWIHACTNAPVPWPYLVEESVDLFGWSYALMPRLPGTSPADLRSRVGPAELCGIARAMGSGLADLHAGSAPGPGEYEPERRGIAPLEVPFADHVLRSLRASTARALEIPGALDAEDLALIDRVGEEGRNALAEPFQACCVHLDYKEGNVLVERAGDGWRLSGVFDLMTCAFGDGEQDLSRATASLAFPHREAAQSFLASYRARRPLRPGWAERFRVYMLIDRLILWEYGRRNRVWFPEEARFRRFVRPFLALDALCEHPSEASR